MFNQWHNLAVLLMDELMTSSVEVGRRHVPGALRSVAYVWNSQWTRGKNRLELCEEFVDLERPFADAVQIAIEKWCDSRCEIWPEMSDQVTTLVRLRLETVDNFLCTLMLGKESGCFSLIPFPDLPKEEVLRWLLIDWWKANGVDLACDLWIGKQWETDP